MRDSTVNLKNIIVLVGLATFCTLAHFFLIQWLVHLVGHGYKWITAGVVACWCAVVFLLVANYRLHRFDSETE